jgi:uncharacterized phage protein (TIGR01671 family)
MIDILNQQEKLTLAIMVLKEVKEMTNRFEELKQNILPRFWDINTEEMLYPSSLVGRSRICYMAKRRKRFYLEECLTSLRFIRMKPTGLEDKNGKLIYENDVVKDDENQKLTVIFKNGCFYLSNGSCGMTIDQFYINEYEIIGNIHENPDILND